MQVLPILLFIVFLKLYALQLATGAFRPLISGGDSRCSWVSSRTLGPRKRGWNLFMYCRLQCWRRVSMVNTSILPLLHIQHLQVRGLHGWRIQTNSFCIAFIVMLPKIGERSFLKNTVTHSVGRGFITMQWKASLISRTCKWFTM